jgi:hypothetical protein
MVARPVVPAMVATVGVAGVDADAVQLAESVTFPVVLSA